MRSILFLVFITSFNLFGLSQRPSQKEMEAQMKQVKKETQEQISALEKDIALAKAKNEDPESIKQMENQLATLRQIVGGVDKMGSLSNKQPETLAPPTTAEPKYVSPFVPVPVKQTLVTPTKEQAKDQLLWYTGKRIDANTLVTTSGMIVRYDKVKNRIIIQPDKRVDSPDHYYCFINTLAQTSQMRNGFVAAVNGMKNIFFMYPEIQKAYDDFYFFRDRFYDIAKNTIDLPNVPHQPLETLHHQLIVSMATLPSPRNILLPPERPNSLCDCSNAKQKQYKAQLEQWVKDFSQQETTLLNLIAVIYLTIDASGITLPTLDGDIVKAFNVVIERLTEKLEELTNRYKSDVLIEDGLVLFTKYFQTEVMTKWLNPKASSTITLKNDAQYMIWQAHDLVSDGRVFEKYVQDRMAALDFNAVFDITLYESHELNRKICNDNNNVVENIEKWVEQLDGFNRFALSMELDFDYTIGDEWEATGQLKSDYIIVSLGKDDCGWHLNLKDPDYTDRSGNEEPFQIPFNVLPGGVKFIKDLGTFPYSGPPKMNMIFPVFKIDLCPNTPNDKVYLQGLRFSDADIASHPNEDFSKIYSMDLFQYVNKMLVSVLAVKDNSSNVVSGALEMINLNAGNINTRPPSTGNRTLDQMMMNYLMDQKRKSLQENVTQTTHTGNTVVPFDAKNSNSTLISTTYSTISPTDRDGSVGIKMKKSNITITVTHSPL